MTTKKSTKKGTLPKVAAKKKAAKEAVKAEVTASRKKSTLRKADPTEVLLTPKQFTEAKTFLNEHTKQPMQIYLAPEQMEAAIRAGLIEESPAQISPEQADKLCETWTSHEDWRPDIPLTASEIVEQAWENVKDEGDPEFKNCVPSWQEKLQSHAQSALKSGTSGHEGTQLTRFELEVIRLNKEK